MARRWAHGGSVKRVFSILGGVFAVLLVVALVAPSFVDWSFLRPQISQAAREATGRDLVIDGDMSLSLLPKPAFQVDGVRLENARGGSAPDMVRIGSVSVEIAVAPLLSGAVQVERVVVDDLQVLLETVDGTPNWEFAPAATPAPTATPAEGGGSAAPAIDLSFDEILVQDSTLTFRDPAGTETNVEAIDLVVALGSLTGPFRAEGSLTALDNPLTVAAQVGALDGPAGVPVSANVGVAGDTATLSLSGRIADPTGTPSFTGSIAATAEDLAATLAAAHVAAPPVLAKPLRLEAQVTADAAQVGVNELEVALGPIRGAGAVSALLGDLPQIDGTLAFSRIDLDALLADLAPAAPSQTVETTQSPAPATDDTSPAPFALPTDVTASLGITVEAVAYNGGAARDVAVDASLADGVLTVSRVTATLPGATALAASGVLYAVEGAPDLRTRLNLRSDNLRGLLDWAEVPTDGVGEDRLRQLSLDTQVRVTPDVVQVYETTAQLDTSTLTGAAAVALRDRPSFSVEASIDRLNLDAYLPEAPTDASTGAASSSTTPPSDTASAASAADPLAVLGTFDTNTTLRVGSLTVAGQQLGGVVLDGSLIGGALTLRQAEVAELAGGAARLTGTATGLGSTEPQFDLNLTARARDLGRVLRGFDIEPPSRLGEAAVDLALSGTGTDTRVVGTAAVDAVAVDLDARLDPTAHPLAASGTATLTSPSLARLSQLAGAGLAPGRADGPVRLDTSVALADNTLHLDGTLDAAAARTALNGTVAELDAAPTVDLTLNIEGRETAATLAGLGIGYRPADPNLGPLTLAMTARGGGTAPLVTTLDGTFGPTPVEGSVTVDATGARPDVVAALTAGMVDLNRLTPRPETARAAPGRSGGSGGTGGGSTERWSTEPIDFSTFTGFDMRADLNARGIRTGNVVLTDATLTARLENGVLEINPVGGGLFDGQLTATARIDARDVPRFATNLRIDDAAIEEATGTLFGWRPAIGTAQVTAQLGTTGRSIHDWIHNLAGPVEVRSTDGTMQVPDLSALRNIDSNPAALAGLLGGGGLLSGLGTTTNTYSELGGSGLVTGGVLDSRDLRAVFGDGTMAGTAIVDLPNWRLDSNFRYVPQDLPILSALGVRLVGPLDSPATTFGVEGLNVQTAPQLVPNLLDQFLRQ